MILDLDETLVHCNETLDKPYDHLINIKFANGDEVDVKTPEKTVTSLGRDKYQALRARVFEKNERNFRNYSIHCESQLLRKCCSEYPGPPKRVHHVQTLQRPLPSD